MHETLLILHQELAKIDLQHLKVEDLYFCDKDTGEFVKIAEVIPESTNEIIEGLRKRHQSKTKYALMYQKSLEVLCGLLTANELRILMYMAAVMKYENAIYDLTYRGIAKKLRMGIKTVSNVMNSLIDHKLVCKVGTTQKKIYFITPVLLWKGAWHRQRYRMAMFEDDDGAVKK